MGASLNAVVNGIFIGLPMPTVCASASFLQVDGVFWWNFLMETRSWDVDDAEGLGTMGIYGNHPTIAGESNGINQPHHIGKIMGRSWEDHGKIMGRSWCVYLYIYKTIGTVYMVYMGYMGYYYILVTNSCFLTTFLRDDLWKSNDHSGIFHIGISPR